MRESSEPSITEEKFRKQLSLKKREGQEKNRSTVLGAVEELHNIRYDTYLNKLKQAEQNPFLGADGKTRRQNETEEVDYSKEMTIQLRDVTKFFKEKKDQVSRQIEQVRRSRRIGQAEKEERLKVLEGEAKKWSIRRRTIHNALNFHVENRNLTRKNSRYYISFRKKETNRIKNEAYAFGDAFLRRLLKRDTTTDPVKRMEWFSQTMGTYFIFMTLEGVRRAHSDSITNRYIYDLGEDELSNREWFLRTWMGGSVKVISFSELFYHQILAPAGIKIEGITLPVMDYRREYERLRLIFSKAFPDLKDMFDQQFHSRFATSVD